MVRTELLDITTRLSDAFTWTWKIQPREFAMVGARRRIIGQRRRDRIREDAEVDLAPLYPHGRSVVLPVPADPLIARRIVATFPPMTPALVRRGEPQITAAIIQGVAVDVVDLKAWRGLHKPAMHRFSEVTRVAAGIVGPCRPVSVGKPAKLREVGIVLTIDDRH
jgi:hypothetical protein